MSVFSGENNQTPDTAETSETQENQSYVKALVEAKGEQWQDPELIAKGKLEADKYIEDLKAEIEQLKELASKGAKVGDLISKMEQKAAEPVTAKPPSNVEDGSEGSKTKGDFSEDSIQSLVEKTLTEREQQNTVKQNLEQVESHLTEMFGTEATSVVDKKAKELGLTNDRLQEIASESPSAFFALIGEKPPEFKPMTQGSVRTESVNMQSSGKKNNAYFSKLRRENPRLFHSPQTQEAMIQERIKQGEAFYN